MALQSKNRLIIHMLKTEAKTRANKNFRLWRWLQKCEVFSYRAYPVGSKNCFVHLFSCLKASGKTKELAYCCVVSANCIFPIHPVTQSWKFGTLLAIYCWFSARWLNSSMLPFEYHSILPRLFHE